MNFLKVVAEGVNNFETQKSSYNFLIFFFNKYEVELKILDCVREFEKSSRNCYPVN